jgi:hypothetical protein
MEGQVKKRHLAVAAAAGSDEYEVRRELEVEGFNAESEHQNAVAPRSIVGQNTIAPTIVAHGCVSPFFFGPCKKSNDCRSYLARPALPVALDNEAKADDELMPVLLQNSDVQNVNGQGVSLEATKLLGYAGQAGVGKMSVSDWLEQYSSHAALEDAPSRLYFEEQTGKSPPWKLKHTLSSDDMRQSLEASGGQVFMEVQGPQINVLTIAEVAATKYTPRGWVPVSFGRGSRFRECVARLRQFEQ